MGVTNIQWTSGVNGEPGYTFNPWIGCREVALECKNCYAKTLDNNRFSKTLGEGTKEHPISHWGSGPRHRTSESNWKQPLAWNRKASGAIDRPRVFCLSLGDWLDDQNVPIEWLADLLKLIHDTQNLDWLLLTKRPQNWEARLSAVNDLLSDQHAYADGGDDPCYDLRCWVNEWLYTFNLKQTTCGPSNVWIGVSAGADQSAALDIPARVHFLSCEPMLKPVDLSLWSGYYPQHENQCVGSMVAGVFVILGGESGKKARPCHIEWIRDGIRQCRAAGFPVFIKQLGANVWRNGKRIVLKDSHGGDMNEWPIHLRIREFPIEK